MPSLSWSLSRKRYALACYCDGVTSSPPPRSSLFVVYILYAPIWLASACVRLFLLTLSVRNTWFLPAPTLVLSQVKHNVLAISSLNTTIAELRMGLGELDEAKVRMHRCATTCIPVGVLQACRCTQASFPPPLPCMKPWAGLDVHSGACLFLLGAHTETSGRVRGDTTCCQRGHFNTCRLLPSRRTAETDSVRSCRYASPRRDANACAYTVHHICTTASALS